MNFPFLYLEKVKRPGKKYFVITVLQTDFVLLLLSFIPLSSHPIIHSISIFLLLLSFWCIYEIGYYENDVVAEKFECNPVLSETYSIYKNTFREWISWLWAFLFLVLSIYLLESTKSDSFLETIQALDIIKWIIFLILVRGTFYVYNYLDKKTRVWLYQVLQFEKYFGYCIFLPISKAGVSLLLSQVLAASSAYTVYRYSKGSWPDSFPIHSLRLSLFFLLLGSELFHTKGISIFNWQVLLISIYCVFRARHEISDFLSNVHFIWKEKGMNDKDTLSTVKDHTMEK